MTTTSLSPDRGSSRFRPGLIVLALFIANFVEGVLVSSAAVVAPAVGQLLTVSAGELNLATVVQLIASVVAVPIIARLGDVYGHRRLLRITVMVTIAGTLLCALAVNYPMYLTGKALEGGIAGFTALAIGIVRDHLEPAKANRGAATVVAGLLVGGLVGQLLTGAVFAATDNVRIVLFVPFVFFAVSLILLFVMVPETRTRAVVRIDWFGAVTFALGLSTLMTVIANLSRWGYTSPLTIGITLAAIALMVVWCVIELRVSEPFIDVRAIVDRATGPFYLVAFGFGWASWGTSTAFSTFLATPDKVGYGFGFVVTQIALFSAIGTVGSAAASFAVGRLGSRRGYLAASYAGLGSMIVGYVVMCLWSGTLPLFIVGYVLVMIGVGTVATSIPVVISAGAKPTAVGIITALYTTSRGIAGAVAGAVFSLVLTSMVLKGTEVPTEGGYIAVWLTCAGTVLLAVIVVALFGIRRPLSGVTAALSITSTEGRWSR